ncbi:hypothetical protein HaLaN_06306, partial [Haematococcus lacustris]
YHFHEPETEAVLLAAQDPDNPGVLSLLADLSRAVNKDVVPAAGTEDSCVCFEWCATWLPAGSSRCREERSGGPRGRGAG